jgi:hypothetical protein
MDELQPIPKGRGQLSQVLQSAGEIISVEDVTTTLQMDRRQATKVLARWNAQGWIKRLQRGSYAPVPIASLGQSQVLDDPWLTAVNRRRGIKACAHCDLSPTPRSHSASARVGPSLNFTSSNRSSPAVSSAFPSAIRAEYAEITRKKRCVT